MKDINREIILAMKRDTEQAAKPTTAKAAQDEQPAKRKAVRKTAKPAV